ncbi:Ubiquitin carboxyl-terminal hydrolase 2 [Escovopsis weberi]|uniref:Ubiquitin carboxyl-terminal hydrolase n=1 Tax=Escovopsis weberi TaxID=150374 RepID=A0A0M8MS78_ESCWE|nr:Ubiquitin carboxyl-terminal hydrolase 2 [Escovopsis weberi]
MSGGWNTIESDAGVFTSLIESLGVKDVQCEELLALDAEELLALQPLYGVIFLFKYPTDGPYADASGPLDGRFDHDAAQDLFFAAQTIQNACATQALLSVLLNQAGSGDGAIDVGAELASFREFGMPLPPEFRGEALSNSELIRGAHNSFARSSPFADETQRAGAEPEDAFHFVAYTPVAGVLYELDGLQPAPISHGPCAAGEFPAKVVDVLRRRVARYEQSEIRFNLLAMCRDLRIRAREFGDAELVEREDSKRRTWMVENALRRHNFVGFAGEMLKQVIGDVLEKRGEPGVAAWVQDGLERRRAEERSSSARKKGDDRMEE